MLASIRDNDWRRGLSRNEAQVAHLRERDARVNHDDNERVGTARHTAAAVAAAPAAAKAPEGGAA